MSAILLAAPPPVAAQVNTGDRVRLWMGVNGIHEGLFRRTDSTGLSIVALGTRDTITFPFEGMQRAERYRGRRQRDSGSFGDGLALGALLGSVVGIMNTSASCQKPCESFVSRGATVGVSAGIGAFIGGILGAIRSTGTEEFWMPFDPRTLVAIPEP